MIPLSDDNPSRSRPYVVYGLVAVNVGIFLAGQIGYLMRLRLFENWSMIPYSVIHDVRISIVQDRLGHIAALQMPAIGPHPQWITILTSMFMHGGWMHIGGNMLYLWIFGNNLEDALGHIKFLLFYLVCGALAAGAHIVMSGGLAAGIPIPHSGGAIALAVWGAAVPNVGASGAIAGVLGAYLVLYPRARINTLVTLPLFWTDAQIPAFYVLGAWFLMQLTGTFGTGGQVGGGVAYWAHVGGFVAGMLLILILGGKKLTRPRRSNPSPWKEDRPYPFRPWK